MGRRLGRVCGALVLLLTFGCADPDPEPSTATEGRTQGDESDPTDPTAAGDPDGTAGTEGDAEGDVEPDPVVLTVPLYIAGAGPSCGAPFDVTWCHFADVDDHPGTRNIKGTTECRADQWGPLSHIEPGYRITLRDEAGTVIGVEPIAENGEFEHGYGIVEWGPDRAAACLVTVTFDDVPATEFYQVTTDDGEIQFAASEVGDEDDETRTPPLVFEAD